MSMSSVQGNNQTAKSRLSRLKKRILSRKSAELKEALNPQSASNNSLSIVNSYRNDDRGFTVGNASDNLEAQEDPVVEQPPADGFTVGSEADQQVEKSSKSKKLAKATLNILVSALMFGARVSFVALCLFAASLRV